MRAHAAILVLVLSAAISALSHEQLPEFGFPVANSKQKPPIEVQSVRGIVVDEVGAVIPKAEIVLRRKEGEHSVEITHDAADSAGRFRLSAPKGKYEVVIHKMGFKDEIVPLSVSRKGGPGFKVVMKAQAMAELNSNAGAIIAEVELYTVEALKGRAFRRAVSWLWCGA